VPSGETTCQFCGSTAPPLSAPSRSDVFARVKSSPEYQRRTSPERQAALPKYPAIAKVLPAVVIVMFIGGSAFMAVMMLVVGGVFGVAGARLGGPMGGGLSLAPLLMALCPMAFVALGVFIFLHLRKKMREFQQAPILADAALIVGKRTQVSGGSGDSSATTRYFVTVEREDGSRTEFLAMTPDLYSRVAEEDAGVLFTRSTLALDFDRVAT
jgi:hypothetical protein